MPDFSIGPGIRAKIDALHWTPGGPEVYFSQTDAAGNIVAPALATCKLSMAVCVEGIVWYDSVTGIAGATTFV